MIKRWVNNFLEPYKRKSGVLIVRPKDDPLWEQEMVEVKPEGQLLEDLCLLAFGIIVIGIMVILFFVCDPKYYALAYSLLSLLVSIIVFVSG